jgi:hypothetical protein
MTDSHSATGSEITWVIVTSITRRDAPVVMTEAMCEAELAECVDTPAQANSPKYRTYDRPVPACHLWGIPEAESEVDY